MIGNDVWLTNFQSLAGATLGSLTYNTNTHKYHIPVILDLLGSFTQQISDQNPLILGHDLDFTGNPFDCSASIPV